MKLSLLPVELLQTILGLCNAQECLSLYSCGDKQLNYRLHHGGARNLTLGVVSWPSMYKWPLLLQTFGNLRILRLYSRFNGFTDSSRIGYALRRMNPFLEELCVRGIGATNLFSLETSVAPIFALDSMFDEFEQCSIDDKGALNGDSENIAAEYSIWDLNEIFPNLKKLSLIFSRSAMWNSHDLALLPRELTSFTYKARNIEAPDDPWRDISNLPKTLQSMRLSPHQIHSDCFSQFPPSLTELRMFMTEEARTIFDQSQHVIDKFASLAYLETSRPWVPPPVWPTHLTELVIAQQMDLKDSIFWSRRTLPPGLQFLDISPPKTVVLEPHHLRTWLPRTLTTLRAHISSLQLVDVGDWPSNLQTLDIWLDTLSTSEFCKYPRSLTHLDVQMLRNWHANRRAKSEEEAENLQAISQARAMLQTIDSERYCTIVEDYHKGRIPTATFEGIEKGHHLGLPLFLRTLKLQSFADFSCLPYLENYEAVLKVPNDEGSKNLLRSSPPLLRSIDLSFSMITTRAQLSSHASGLEWPRETLSPVNLTCLSIRGAQLPANNWKYLPPTLLELFIRTNGSAIASLEDLKSLPPRLKVLHGSYYVPEGNTCAWASALPRTLEHLALQGCEIDGADLKNLPPHLRSLRLAWARSVTLDHIAALPQTLESANVTLHPSKNEEKLLSFKGRKLSRTFLLPGSNTPAAVLDAEYAYNPAFLSEMQFILPRGIICITSTLGSTFWPLMAARSSQCRKFRLDPKLAINLFRPPYEEETLLEP